MREVAKRLAETLSGLNRPGLEPYRIKLGWLLHAESDVALETAMTVLGELASDGNPHVQTRADPDFNDVHASPYSGPYFKAEKTKALKAVNSGLEDALANGSNAVMVVGHQPLLSELARTFLRRRAPWPTAQVPLARGEIACLAGRSFTGTFHASQLLWTIAPSDDAAMVALRDKISAKMNVAGFLSGVIGAALVFLLQGILDRTRSEASIEMSLRYAAAAALFVAVWLYLSTVYACDRLLMPTRFWGEARNPADISRRPRWLVWRPPGSDAWVVYQNMLRVWRWQFVPATCFLVAGIGLLGVALWRPMNTGEIVLPIVAVALLIAALLIYSYWRRPHLGVED
jgi:hypothetical protein